MYDYMNDLTNQVQNFNKMLTLLKYRGPDDFNIASSEHVLLGHCRLSIIDLNGGKQPFIMILSIRLYIMVRFTI